MLRQEFDKLHFSALPKHWVSSALADETVQSAGGHR